MRIHGNNATRYGNTRKCPTTAARQNDCNARRLMGKIVFVIVLPISSMVRDNYNGSLLSICFPQGVILKCTWAWLTLFRPVIIIIILSDCITPQVLYSQLNKLFTYRQDWLISKIKVPLLKKDKRIKKHLVLICSVLADQSCFESIQDLVLYRQGCGVS